jgi:hypothetical protein
VNHLSKSVVRENRTPRSVGTGGGQLPPVTRSQGCNSPALLDLEPAARQASPIAREATIVGIDGGYLRNWHDKRKKFEVIVGKSMVEDRDDRYLVRSQDAAPR